MASIVNPADQALAATSPRLVTVNLSNNLNLVGSIGGVTAGDVARKIYIQGSKVFSETWDGDAATRYTVQEGNSAEVSTITAAAQIGNRFLRIGNNTTPDQIMVVFNELIPFDATRLYRIQVIARRSSAGTNIPLYAGYIGMAADGVTPVSYNGATGSYGNAHNHAVNGTILQGPSAWTTFEGFTKGTATPGDFGVGTRTVPSKVHPNVKYLRPYILCNFGVAGTTEINAILIDDITDVAILETKTDQIGSSYVVKLTTEGLVGGFGLYNTGSTVTAGFDVDEFYIGKTVGNRVKPFVLSNGVVYINSAAIADASIGSAKIADTIQSTTFNATQGWQINKSGTATFNQLTIRTSSGNIGGITIGDGFIRGGQTAFNTGAGFYLGSNGNFSLGDSTTNNRLIFNSSTGTLTIRGSLNASDITAGTLSASYISGGAIAVNSFIQSTTYTAGSGTTGWRINADGTSEFRSITARGSVSGATINAGDFIGYAWPAGTGSGGHLGSLGLLVGNANDTTKACLEFNASAGTFFVGKPEGHYILFQSPTTGSTASTGLFTVNGDIITTGNIKRLGVSDYVQSSSATQQIIQYFSVPGDATGILIEESLGPPTRQEVAGCFAAGTLISTPLGKVRIENIKLNDLIYAFDNYTGEIKLQKVKHVFIHDWNDVGKYSPLVKITHETGTISVTTNHLMYSDEKGWQAENNKYIAVEDLEVGDYLTLENNTKSRILAIEDLPDYDKVYNLEVSEHHNYIADGIRVHNNQYDTGGFYTGKIGSTVLGPNLIQRSLYGPGYDNTPIGNFKLGLVAGDYAVVVTREFYTGTMSVRVLIMKR